MEILPEQPSAKGPAKWFTGDVWIDAIVRGEEPSRIRVSMVRFTPSARTAWHAHALGQSLYVTEGTGLCSPWQRYRQDPGGGRYLHTPGRVALARRRTGPFHGPPLHDRGRTGESGSRDGVG